MNERELILREDTISDSDNGYIRRIVYSEPLFSEVSNTYCLSSIEKYDSDSHLLNIRTFEDDSFKKNNTIAKRVYNKDESYKEYVQISKPSPLRHLSHINEFDSNDKPISSKIFKDYNFKEIYIEITYKYNEDGSYIRRLKFTEPEEDGFQAYIEEYDSYERLTKCERFSDANFKYLERKENYDYDIDGSSTKYSQYNKPDANGIMSTIQKYNYKGLYLSEKRFIDNNFNDLLLTLTREYGKDGSYTNHFEYMKPNSFGFLTTTEAYDLEGRFLYGIAYSDKKSQNIQEILRFKHKGNGEFIKIRICEKLIDSKYYAQVIKYSKNNNVIWDKKYKKFAIIFACLRFLFA